MNLPTLSRFPDGSTPTWEIAYFFPAQDSWTDADYLGLESMSGDNILAELTDGRLEVLPMPTQSHQLIILFVLKALETFCEAHAPGRVLFAGIRVKLRSGKYRQPDLVYMKEENLARCYEEYWDGADWVMEVVSGDAKDRQRDIETKPVDYAKARIPEYWIIDPDDACIRVLTLQDDAYELHGEFRAGQEASGKLLPGFTLSMDDILDIANRK